MSASNGIANGKMTIWHVIAAVVPVFTLVGPAIGFYIHDRDHFQDLLKDAYIRIGDNAAKNQQNQKAIEDLVVSLATATAAIEGWQAREMGYDSEMRTRINDISVRLHQRIDELVNHLIPPAQDYMAVPQHGRR